ncbi:hypothetical protein A0H81_03022, partial [Grifola frondosa]
MSSLPERKRARVDRKYHLVEHPTLYMNDGDVIIRARNTLFCVHHSLISKHSPVLRELLDAQEGIKPRFRGCRYLVSGNAKEDMEAFLSVIYDGFSFPRLTAENFLALSRILRMATAYDVEPLRSGVVKLIKEEWPSALDKHDAKMDALRIRQMQRSPYATQGGRIIVNPHYDPAIVAQGRDTTVHPASIIVLLRECGYTDRELYFPLFYAMSLSTFQFGRPALGRNIAPLSYADIERFIIGLERLRSRPMQMMIRVPAHMWPALDHYCFLEIRRFWPHLRGALLE